MQVLRFIEQKLSEYKNNEASKWSTAYMKDHFKFLGVKKPLIKSIYLEVVKNFNLSLEEIVNLIDTLYLKDYREYQYLAIYFLEKSAKKLNENHLSMLEKIICKDSWWDTVDTLSANVIGVILYNLSLVQRKKYLDKWENSGNMWLLRVCIIHQLKYKNNTNRDYLAYICEKSKLHKDFFIRKAIGWALREFSKVDYNWVNIFVANNHDLSSLSKKEALRLK